jgi:hypothetical protein
LRNDRTTVSLAQLAAQYPELANEILALPLVGQKPFASSATPTPSPTRIRIRLPYQESNSGRGAVSSVQLDSHAGAFEEDGRQLSAGQRGVHTPDKPNWALAPDDDKPGRRSRRGKGRREGKGRSGGHRNLSVNDGDRDLRYSPVHQQVPPGKFAVEQMMTGEEGGAMPTSTRNGSEGEILNPELSRGTEEINAVEGHVQEQVNAALNLSHAQAPTTPWLLLQAQPYAQVEALNSAVPFERQTSFPPGMPSRPPTAHTHVYADDDAVGRPRLRLELHQDSTSGAWVASARDDGDKLKIAPRNPAETEESLRSVERSSLGGRVAVPNLPLGDVYRVPPRRLQREEYGWKESVGARDGGNGGTIDTRQCSRRVYGSEESRVMSWRRGEQQPGRR